MCTVDNLSTPQRLASVRESNSNYAMMVQEQQLTWISYYILCHMHWPEHPDNVLIILVTSGHSDYVLTLG